MSQIWALIAPDGSYVFKYTASAEHHPSDYGEAEACQGRVVKLLEREPLQVLGEDLDALGEIVFDLNLVEAELVAEIKAEAGRRILAQVPIWRQINDLDTPSDPAVIARKQIVVGIRDWSNQLEAQLAEATTPEDIQAIRGELL